VFQNQIRISMRLSTARKLLLSGTKCQGTTSVVPGMDKKVLGALAPESHFLKLDL
jgi:hypothetical protein